jgi:hypothetical protein
MNKKLGLMVGCAAVGFLGGVGSASAKVVDNVHFKGKVAAAVCSATESIACGNGSLGTVERNVFVSGQELFSKTNTFPTVAQNGVFVTIVTNNTCTNEFSASFGSVDNAFSQQAMQSAALHGVLSLKDVDTEEPRGQMSVDVSLEGFGVVQQDKDELHFHFDDENGDTIAIFVHFKGKTRSATGSGTLSLNGTPITCTFHDGSLLDTSSGSRTLLHP